MGSRGEAIVYATMASPLSDSPGVVCADRLLHFSRLYAAAISGCFSMAE